LPSSQSAEFGCLSGEPVEVADLEEPFHNLICPLQHGLCLVWRERVMLHGCPAQTSMHRFRVFLPLLGLKERLINGFASADALY
jgi:hypothetical protein